MTFIGPPHRNLHVRFNAHNHKSWSVLNEFLVLHNNIHNLYRISLRQPERRSSGSQINCSVDDNVSFFHSTHRCTHTHTHTQDKEPIECSAVTALHNKGKLGLTERESTQPGPKSSWNWTFDSCLRGCLCEIVTSIPSNKNSRLHPCIQPVQKVSPNRSTSDRWAWTKGLGDVWGLIPTELHRHYSSLTLTHSDMKRDKGEEAVYGYTPR